MLPSLPDLDSSLTPAESTLYWCFFCFKAMHYSITDWRRVHVTHFDDKPISKQENAAPTEDWPYANFPRVFQRQRIGLSRRMVKRRLRGLKLAQIIGHRVGGVVFCPQGDEWIVCRSRGCLERGKPLSFLAVVHNNPYQGLPLIESLESVKQDSSWGGFTHFESVYFHICPSCKQIHAHSQH